MDLSKLNTKPASPIISGTWTRVWIGIRSQISTFPQRDSDDKTQISDDIVFASGYSWIPFYTTEKTTKLEESGSDEPDNDACTTTFTCMVAGLDQVRKQFVAEYGKEKMVVLIQKCGMPYPLLIGDYCSSATMSWKYTEGENGPDKSGREFTFTRVGAFDSAFYKGAIEGSNVFAADDATPSVAIGSTFITGTNTAATAITNLDNAIVGSTLTILGGGGTNASTIANSGNFTLTEAWTATAGSYITLYVRGANDFVELARG